MDLHLNTRQATDATVVEVGGEVDLHSAPQLREELYRACAEGGSCVVVDLSGVSFIDSTGLGVLIGGLKRAREKGSLILAGLQPRVLRVFEVTGLTTVFDIRGSAEEALEACAPVERRTPQAAAPQGGSGG